MPKSKRGSARPVPYVKGFRPATAKQQERALGSHVPPEFTTSSNHFKSVPKCTSIDDWLAQYKEKGQMYEDFLRQTPWLSRRPVKYCKQTFVAQGVNMKEKYPDGVIYVLPLGDFHNSACPSFDALVEYTQIFFGLSVKKLPPVKLEMEKGNMYWVDDSSSKGILREKLKSRYNAKSGRYQLCIDQSLLKLRTYMPADALCMIALTMCDLYEDTPDLFVAGMAAGNQRVAIFSLHRYDPNLTFSKEFWYCICETLQYDEQERKRLMLQRSCRLLVHEISHLLGLSHCIYFECCMNGSGHLAEDFRQPMFLCPVDLRKLQALCGFNVLNRYEKMKGFFDKHGMDDESKWYEDRIACLRKEAL